MEVNVREDFRIALGSISFQANFTTADCVSPFFQNQYDVKGGAAGGFWNLLQAPNLNHRTEITPGVLNDDCVRILKEFFAEARRRRAEGLEHKKGAAKEATDDGVVFDGP